MKVKCEKCGEEFYERGLPAHKHARHSGDGSPWHDEERLRELYVGEDMSYSEIADRLGCGEQTVGRYIQRYGIRDEKRKNGSEYGGYYIKQAKKRRELDNNECQWCGRDGEEYEEESGRALDVHHITPVSEFKKDGVVDGTSAHSIDNLITVCRQCHRAIEQLEQWQVVEVLNL